MPVKTRSMIKREQFQQFQRIQQLQQLQQEQDRLRQQEEELFQEYENLKYIDGLNLLTSNITPEFFKDMNNNEIIDVYDKLTIRANKLINLQIKIQNMIKNDKLCDLTIDIVITLYKYTEGIFISLKLMTYDIPLSKIEQKKLLITSFNKIKEFEETTTYTDTQKNKLMNSMKDYMFNVVKYI
jgi:hypothetical protein